MRGGAGITLDDGEVLPVRREVHAPQIVAHRILGDDRTGGDVDDLNGVAGNGIKLRPVAREDCVGEGSRDGRDRAGRLSDRHGFPLAYSPGCLTAGIPSGNARGIVRAATIRARSTLARAPFFRARGRASEG